MTYTPTELKNISKLLLSVDDANVELAFVLIEQGEISNELITELFAIYKLGNRQHSRMAKDLLMTCVDSSKGLLHIINRQSLLNGSSPRKKIKSFASDCPDLNPMKLALALYNKYDEGLQYLVSELPEEDLKGLLLTHLSNGKFELKHKKITKIPAFVFKDYTHIKELNLSYNQIKTLPAGIGKLVDLERLDLSGNKITKLNKAIGKLEHLEELNLKGNNIKELPKEIADLKNLKVLNLERVSLDVFPKVVTQLPNLERLNLRPSSYSPGPVDESFFSFKTDKLIELIFDAYHRQSRWTNLPRITSVTGTYEDPIDTNPLALAHRAYNQKGEGVEYLLEHASSEYIHELLTSFVEGNTLKLEKLYLNSLPKELANYNIKELVLENTKLCKEEIWEDLSYMPELEVLDLGMSSGFDFWVGNSDFPKAALKRLTKLKKLKLGTIDYRDILEQIIEFTNLEELWFWKYITINSSDDFYKLDGYQVLKKLPNLKEFCLRGINNDFYNQPEKAKEIKEGVADYLSQWLPKGCKAIVGSNDISIL